ncbi:unnamed protein product [Tilletia laevis]|uniref:Uncharacterized protein n=2 Tax=Tilletia TaxID=13289 RepID=A0A177VAN5_9BASI|nr:hypothetical protein CF336_g775 [Tilletia laevis]KAE8262983.1 hypothetical protein A4X03_0g2023 [Tilletia caries]KAE8203061.1 hypothetical protein CF335_g3178 [Tilletia laevis]CAD6890874.1 unnamed protein product [Tilletia caries]CAD6902250.1 unnamed protein product [Tilletia laevis]
MLVAEPPRLVQRSFDMGSSNAFHQSSASGLHPQTSLYSYSNHHHQQVNRPPPQLDAKVVILGSQGVGKTSMVHRYTVEDFDPRATPSTIGAQFSAKKILCDGVKVRLQLWDTAGQERYKSMMPLYYRGSHAAVIVYDITSRKSFEDVKGWVEELRKNMADDLVIHIVGSKLDLADNARAVEIEEARDAIRSWFAPPPPPEPAPRPSASTSSLFFPSSSTNEAASHAVSGLTRAVSTRLAGMRANSFTKSYNSSAAPNSLSRSKTSHVAVPGRTTSTTAGGAPPLIQARGASMDALRNVPFPSPPLAEGYGDGHLLPSASASMGRQNSLTGGGGGRQLLARMRTNSSINIFPSLMTASSSSTGQQQSGSPGAGPCAQCEAATSSSSRSPSSTGGGGGGSSSHCSHHTSTSSMPPGMDELGPSSSSHKAVLEGPIMVMEGIELSEVSAKDDEGIEYVFNAIARKLVERRMKEQQQQQQPCSGSGVSQASGGGAGAGAGESGRGSNMLGGSEDSHLLSAADADSHLRRRRGGGAGTRAGSASRQSILLHQPEPDEDEDDGIIEGIGLGNDAGGMSGFAGVMHGGGSAFTTHGGGGSTRPSRPASVHLDRRGRDQEAGWSSCCAT